MDLAATPTGTIPGLTYALSTTSLEYILDAGPHTGQGFQESEDATLDFTLPASSAGNATQNYTITATFGGGSVCTSAGAVPESEDTADFWMEDDHWLDADDEAETDTPFDDQEKSDIDALYMDGFVIRKGK